MINPALCSSCRSGTAHAASPYVDDDEDGARVGGGTFCVLTEQ